MSAEVFENPFTDAEVSFDTYEFRGKTLDRESGQGLRFREFDIHAQEIDLSNTESVEDVVEGRCRGRCRNDVFFEELRKGSIARSNKMVIPRHIEGCRLVGDIRNEQRNENGARPGECRKFCVSGVISTS